MFLCIVLSSCAHTMLNTYIKLLRVLCLRLRFSWKFHGAIFSVCDPVPNGQLRHAQPAQSLYLSSSCMLDKTWVEGCLASQQPLADQLLGHQGMTHRKNLTSLTWCLKAFLMSLRSLMCLRIRFSCVLCIVPFLSNMVLPPQPNMQTTRAFALFNQPQEAQDFIKHTHSATWDELGPPSIKV